MITEIVLVGIVEKLANQTLEIAVLFRNLTDRVETLENQLRENHAPTKEDKNEKE